MPSKTPRAYGLGPLETIVKVGWGGLPAYVSVYTSADRTGLGSTGTPNHTATVTLSPAAIQKGCEIALTHREQVGSPYNAFFGITVIKVPRLVKGKLFTLTLAGMSHERPGDAPNDYFCGTYSDFWTVVRGPDAPADPGTSLRVATYTFTWGWSNPNDGDSGEEHTTYLYNLDDPVSVAFAASLVGSASNTNNYLSYYNGDILVNTGLSCATVPDTSTHIELYPFDDVQIVVNPIKDHVVEVGDIPFIEPEFCVHKPGHTGDETSVWRIFVNRLSQPFVSDGLFDGSYDFSMQVSQFAKSRTEKIIEIWPSTTASPLIKYRAAFRLNKKPPTSNIYPNNWIGTAPDFNDEIILYSGATPPPVVTWVPYNIPF